MTMVLRAAAAPPLVWIGLAEEGGAYAETAATLKSELDAAELKIGRWQDLLGTPGQLPNLIITVGAAAYEGVLTGLADRGGTWERIPVLATLLPQATYHAHATSDTSGRRNLSAAVLDQPIGRQMAFLKRALPERRRVGVLLGPQTTPLLKTLQKEAQAHGLSLSFAQVDTPNAIYPALKAVLDTSDVILALPEPTVYHSTSLQNILLTTYRARVPLVAFSPAYVKSGAVLALYSTPAQVGRRAAEMARSWLAGRGLPPPQSPREFSVVQNAKVAASLDVQIDEAEVIAADLRRQEKSP